MFDSMKLSAKRATGSQSPWYATQLETQILVRKNSRLTLFTTQLDWTCAAATSHLPCFRRPQMLNWSRAAAVPNLNSPEARGRKDSRPGPPHSTRRNTAKLGLRLALRFPPPPIPIPTLLRFAAAQRPPRAPLAAVSQPRPKFKAGEVEFVPAA